MLTTEATGGNRETLVHECSHRRVCSARGDAKTYLHDEVATDKRNPTVNAWGKLYSGTEDSTDNLPILDPKSNSVSYLKMTPRDPDTPRHAFIMTGNFQPLPSPYWGDEKMWDSQTTV